MLPDRATVEAELSPGARRAIFRTTPYVALVIPSALDDSLAPPGHHVMSLLCKYYPYHLADGQHWDAIARSAWPTASSRRSPAISPTCRGSRSARQVLTPLDLERRVRAHRRRHLPRPPRSRSDLQPAAASEGRALPHAGRRASISAARAAIPAAASAAPPATTPPAAC